MDWDGKQLPPVAVGTFDLPAGGVKQATLPDRHQPPRDLPPGLRVDAAKARPGGRRAEFKYAVIVPLKGVGNAEDSVFAMNTHMEREPTAHLARNMEVLSQCGVKWIRGWWGWGMCEKERGKFDWTEYDRQLNAVEAAKMRIMPILLRYYSSVRTGVDRLHLEAVRVTGSRRPRSRSALQERVAEWGVGSARWPSATRAAISRYEIWNEPTMAGPPGLHAASNTRTCCEPLRRP